MPTVTKAARKGGNAKTTKTSARALRSAPIHKTDRKARPVIAIAETTPRKAPQSVRAVSILDTRLEVIDRKADIQGRLGGELLAQCKAANIPMTAAFANDVMEAPAKEMDRLVALLSESRALIEACVKMIDTRALNVPTARAITELSKLLKERRAITGALDLTSGNETLITALVARSLELVEQIINSPARNGAELAAKLSVAIDALNEGEDADSVLPILASCRNDSYSLPAPLPAGCGPASTESF
jgi:hypothetical protein